MPPGVLFAASNEKCTPTYIPREYSEIESLIDKLIDYVNNLDCKETIL